MLIVAKVRITEFNFNLQIKIEYLTLLLTYVVNQRIKKLKTKKEKYIACRKMIYLINIKYEKQIIYFPEQTNLKTKQIAKKR